MKLERKYSLLFPLLIALLEVVQIPQQLALALPQVSENLKVPAKQVLLLKQKARGVQIYECKVKPGNASQFEWKLKAPEAELFDEQGKKTIEHYAGPTWKADDGSKVVGQVKATAASPNPNAIPWLLLVAKSHEGNGILSKVTYIQRLDTVGGKAPVRGCNQSSIGNQVRVNYTADYLFYGATP